MQLTCPLRNRGMTSRPPGLVRLYHDGNVLPDTNPYTFTVTHGDGTTTTYTSPPTAAGFTNTWSLLDVKQETDDGNVAFHSYSASIGDTGIHQKDPDTIGYGVDLCGGAGHVVKIGRKMEWKLDLWRQPDEYQFAHGVAVETATITQTTDTYVANLNGQAIAADDGPRYTAPSWVQVPQVDADGNPVYDSSGAQIIDYVETTVWLSDHPLDRTITQFQGTVTNQWDLKGAYFTFRIGPSISYQITNRLRLVLSAGASLVLSGTEYTVTQTYIPDIADPVISTVDNDELKFLPGYYVDASLQFDITESAGFYAGVTYQDNGSYSQSADLTDPFTPSTASYKAQIDLSNLSGFRMGMTFKF